MTKLNVKGLFTKKRVIIGVILLIVIALIVTFAVGMKKGKGNTAAAAYSEATVARGDITKTIEASGTIEPLDRYEITSLAKGEILSSPFEEGDMVNEGDLLYQIDDEDAQLNIEKTQNSIERAQISQSNTNRDISRLTIYANATGTLSGFNLKEGQQVGVGEIAKITNTGELKVKIPFTAVDFDKISVGDSANVTSALYMTSLSGSVTHKYDSSVSTGSDGSAVKNIEVTIPNPGALTAGTTVGAGVNTSQGTVYSSGSGTIEDGTQTSLMAEVSGTVQTLYVKDGDYVTSGQVIAKLKSDSLNNSQRENSLSLRDSQLSLESSRKQLEDYRITSPISGTIITKSSKVGDKIDNSTASKVMMVVADMSKMKFTISVDELDIGDIAQGQTAVVDADALPNQTFVATVTSIAGEGTIAGDGVTTYSVELTIDEPGELKSGMNVNANIVVAQVNDVLTIPEEALMSSNGATARVMVKSAEGAKGKKDDGKEPPAARSEGEERAPKNGVQPAAEGNPAADSGSNARGTTNGGKSAGGRNAVPDGSEMKEVEIGISDGTNVEIKSGLSEGDTVMYIPSTANSSNNMFMMMGGMGGGMPAGGPGGGAPSGGGNRSGGNSGGNRSGGGAGGPR